MTATEIEDKRTTTISTKESKYDEPIKSFIAPYWTLEYTIALSCLSELFYQAVYICWKSKSRDYTYNQEQKEEYTNEANSKYEQWNNENKTIKEIAYEIYQKTLLDKQISKAVVAQVFSQILSETDLTLYDIRNDEKLEYLVDAISYVTGS
jgi:putative ATP-dependent endonuclease of OLD family